MLVSQKARAVLLAKGKNVVVYLDDGHGHDPMTGATTPGKRTPVMPDGKVVYENQFNHAVVQMLGSILAYHGVRCVPVAAEMADVPLASRVTRANQDWEREGRPEAVYMSVHYNALNGVFDKKSGGVETFHYPGSVKGQKLATAVHKHLLTGVKQANRGVKTARFYVLKYTNMPAALAECGFMDNLVEAGRMLSLSFQLECAREMATGILEYFGMEIVPDIVRSYSAVEHAYGQARIDNKQYWMDVLMGYRDVTVDSLLCLLEE